MRNPSEDGDLLQKITIFVRARLTRKDVGGLQLKNGFKNVLSQSIAEF
jgi:hypothetical protein